MRTTSITVGLTHVECYLCACAFAIPTSLYDRRCEDHGDFWCPNGHRQHFTGKSSAERLREQLDDAYKYANSIASERDSAERSARALRGHLTRQKRRAVAGVCPCCHRTFQQVSRHMANKHPDYLTEEVTV